MQAQLLYNNGTRTYVLALDKGEEVIEALEQFAADEGLSAARFNGLGAVSRARLAFFVREKKDYDYIPVEEQVEVLNLTGNIAWYQDKPKVHAHTVLGRRDGSTLGGHLVEANVWPTLEIMLVATPATLERAMDDESQLPLLDL